MLYLLKKPQTQIDGLWTRVYGKTLCWPCSSSICNFLGLDCSTTLSLSLWASTICSLPSFCCIGHARERVGYTLIMPSVFIIAWWGVGNIFPSMLWQIWARNSKLEIHFPIEYFSLKQKWVSNSYMFNSSWNSWVLYFLIISHFLNCQDKPLSSFYHQY